MIEGQYFQNAYVTRDLGKTLAAFRKRARIRKEILHEGAFTATTPEGTGPIHSKIALVWVDNLQYEFIEPVSGLNAIYTAALPADDRPVFHHACARIADWEEFCARVKAQDFPVVLEGESPAVKFKYLDTRAVLGHILEFTYMPDAAWAAMGGL